MVTRFLDLIQNNKSLNDSSVVARVPRVTPIHRASGPSSEMAKMSLKTGFRLEALSFIAHSRHASENGKTAEEKSVKS